MHSAHDACSYMRVGPALSEASETLHSDTIAIHDQRWKKNIERVKKLRKIGAQLGIEPRTSDC